MTYASGIRSPIARAVVTPFGRHGTVNDVSAPASQTWIGSNLAFFYPLYFWEPYVVANAFWVNGATTGTDSLDLGVYRMTDLSTGRLDLIRSTGPVVSAGTANQTAATNVFRLALAKLAAAGSSTDATSYTTASVTLKAGRLYLLSFTNSKAAAPDAASSVATTGGAVTFTSERTVSFNSAASPTQRLSVFRAVPTADVTDTVVISFGANTQTGACWSLIEISGVDTTTTMGVVQSVSNTVDSGTTVTATLAAFGSANNGSFGATAKGSTGGFTAGTGFNELDDVNAATPAQALETEARFNDTTVDQSWTGNTGAAVIGVEVKSDTTTPFVIPAGWSYLAMVVNGTTATVFQRGLSSRAFSQAAGMYELTSAFPLPSSCIPVAISTNRRAVVAGVSSRATV